METLTLRTREHAEFVDITHEVRDVVSNSGAASGVVRVYVPHTTAGVTINENADPAVRDDMLAATYVSTRVNSVKNDDPACLEPDQDPQQESLFEV